MRSNLTEVLLDRIIESLKPGEGSTDEYFTKTVENGGEEKKLRDYFRDGFPTSNLLPALKKVKYYKTHARDKNLEIFETLFNEYNDKLLNFSKIKLLEGEGKVCFELRDFIVFFLNKAAERKTTRNEYSHLTKFLHFCFPALFVIFDSRALESMIVIDENLLLGISDLKYNSFEYNGEYSKGLFYHALCQFYQKLWVSMDEKRQKYLAREADLLSKRHQNIQFGVIDAFDKFLWAANGDEESLFGKK